MPSTSEVVVRRLLAAAGSREFEARLAEFTALDETAPDLLFAARRGGDRFPVGAKESHPRDVMEDVWYAFVSAARRWPNRFLDRVLADPALREDIGILDALGHVDLPQARELLVAAAHERRAGHAFGRQYALRSLIRLDDPRVPDLLVRLVSDRASLVRFEAVVSAIEHGDPRLIPALRRLDGTETTPLGTREFALDAIEAIAVRHEVGALLPDPSHQRLVAIARPASRSPVAVREVFVAVADRVSAGQNLATIQIGNRTRRVVAAADAVVVTVGLAPGREPAPIMFRLRVRPS